jgi:conjugal transfer pilus assembly protein TraV
MLRNNFIVALVAPCVISGCSTFLPYESDFACKNSDHGKCIHPEAAYAEATAATAPDAAAPGERGAKPDDAVARRDRRKRNSIDASVTLASGYEGYQEAVYSQLASLVEAPVTPMLAPAKTVRTLILPYADERSADRLYMPRYVYSVLEASRFVLGDYLSAPSNDFAGALAGGLLTGPAEVSDDVARDAVVNADAGPALAPRLKPAAALEER